MTVSRTWSYDWDSPQRSDMNAPHDRGQVLRQGSVADLPGYQSRGTLSSCDARLKLRSAGECGLIPPAPRPESGKSQPIAQCLSNHTFRKARNVQQRLSYRVRPDIRFVAHTLRCCHLYDQRGNLGFRRDSRPRVVALATDCVPQQDRMTSPALRVGFDGRNSQWNWQRSSLAWQQFWWLSSQGLGKVAFMR